MRTNKYRNRSILHLLQIDLEQRTHENKLVQIDLSRRRIKSTLRRQARKYDRGRQRTRVNREVANYLRDLRRAEQINIMNRKINDSIERQMFRPVADQFRHFSRREAAREEEASIVRSRSSISVRNRLREESVEAENERLMDRLLSIKPKPQYGGRQVKRDFDKHLEYKNRIRRYSDVNASALLQQVKRFGVEPKVVLPDLSHKKVRKG